MIIDEFNLIRSLDHPKIYRTYHAFTQPGKIYISTEIMRGGSLFDHIMLNKKIPEHQAKVVMRQLIMTIGYLHREGIVHRDMKSENVVLLEKNNLNKVKIIDFGISRKLSEGETLKDYAGTLLYMAPEALEGKYGKEVDLWALGVICF